MGLELVSGPLQSVFFWILFIFIFLVLSNESELLHDECIKSPFCKRTFYFSCYMNLRPYHFLEILFLFKTIHIKINPASATSCAMIVPFPIGFFLICWNISQKSKNDIDYFLYRYSISIWESIWNTVSAQ